MTNKRTAVLKHAILAAAERAGIAAYLERQGEENPVAFMTFSARSCHCKSKATVTTPVAIKPRSRSAWSTQRTPA